jgi:hypothetical protein
MENAMPELSEKYRTRREAIEYVRTEFGVPLTKSHLDKDRMVNDQPRPDAFYGRKELFTEPTLKKYALKFITDKPNRFLLEVIENSGCLIVGLASYSTSK